MATLADISRQTGMGISTVSEVLRGKSGYTKATQDKVTAAARVLDYRPSYAAQALRGGKTKTIGILGGSFKTPITLPKLDAIHTQARENGYVCFIGNLPSNNPNVLVKTVRDLVSRQVDGIIAYTGPHMKEELAEELSKVNIPIVYLDSAPEGAKFHVSINRQAGIEQAAEHLAELGHKKVGFVTTTSDVYDPGLKVDIYRKALHNVDIETSIPWEYVIDPEKSYSDSAYELALQMVSDNDLPTALIMNNDHSALAAMAALLDKGIKVPEDISIIGFDDLNHAKYCRPALTTIHQPREEAGVAAFNMLQKVIEGEVGEGDSLYEQFDCKLIPRQTTGKPRRAGVGRAGAEGGAGASGTGAGGTGVPPVILNQRAATVRERTEDYSWIGPDIPSASRSGFNPAKNSFLTPDGGFHRQD